MLLYFNMIGKFLGIFWFADKLGNAALTGHSIVCRQSYSYQAQTVGAAGVEVNPEYWVSFFWKQLMGRGVLELTASGAGGLVRVYSGVDHTTGAVTAVVINLGANATVAPIIVNGRIVTQHDMYSLLDLYPRPF